MVELLCALKRISITKTKTTNAELTLLQVNNNQQQKQDTAVVW